MSRKLNAVDLRTRVLLRISPDQIVNRTTVFLSGCVESGRRGRVGMDISAKFRRREPLVPSFVLCINGAEAEHTAYAVYKAREGDVANKAAQSGKASGYDS